jgi:cbb3-type cytochrome oxidase subunit 1
MQVMWSYLNNLAIPYSWFQSYTVYEGAQDAIVQWWYGHNAVGFFSSCRSANRRDWEKNSDNIFS